MENYLEYIVLNIRFKDNKIGLQLLSPYGITLSFGDLSLPHLDRYDRIEKSQLLSLLEETPKEELLEDKIDIENPLLLRDLLDKIN